MKNPRFYKLLSAWIALALSIMWLLFLVMSNGVFLLEAILYFFVILGTLGFILLFFPSMAEDFDQAIEAFFYTGFGIMASFLALVFIVIALICISKKHGGWRLKGLLIVGAVLQLIVWDLFSFLTAALYLLAAFLPGENMEALEKRADESVQ
ncbi:hypothetical protein P4282_03200 [Bacillus swezeyi]|uniref:hypothetical protein n=1 Tax=Bacillus swezeyi TaxID=1925020 RepID=UPI002E1D388D|nr:hypothetical protein [Bacillus swezeyi]